MMLSRSFVGRLDPLSLQLFVLAVEERSIARAAQRGGIAASAVSKRISDMEAAIGAPLLCRHRRGVEATDAGRMVLRHARVLLRDLAHFEADVAGYAGGIQGEVRLCATETALLSSLPAQLVTFLQLHPFIKVELRQELSETTLRAVAENSVDFGVVAGDVSADGLRLLPYGQDELVAVVPRGHPLAGGGRVTLADLLAFDLVGQTRQSTIGTLIRTEAARLGIATRTRLWLPDYGAICQVVGAGHGISIVPRDVARIFAAQASVIEVEIDEPWVVRAQWICIRTTLDLSPAAQRLLECLMAGSGGLATATNVTREASHLA